MKTKQQQEPKEKYIFQKYSDKFRDMFSKSAQLISQEKTHIQKEIIPQHISSNIKTSFFFYRVKSIGVGAHSFVHLVQEEETRSLYAQKSIVKLHAKQHFKELANEIKILSHISHDNLIKLYHFYADDSYIHLIMEFAQDSLFALKQKFVIFKEKEIIEILKQLLRGLKYLHEKDIVHADIKLENIMIANGTVKICDFGYAHKIKTETQTKLSPKLETNEQKVEVVGTLEYLSPEYALGKDSRWKRDIWALGILAFELLVGKNPFQGMKQNQKWSKLVNVTIYQSQHPPKQYLEDLKHYEKNLNLNSEKIEDFISKTLCEESERWSARSLLEMPAFL